MPLSSGTQLSCTAVPAPNLTPGSVAISTDVAACVDTCPKRRAACPGAARTASRAHYAESQLLALALALALAPAPAFLA